MNFIYQICYLIAAEDPSLSFDVDNANLQIGELERGVEGVFAVSGASPEPDRYTPIQYFTVDFWSVRLNAETGYDELARIYNLLNNRQNYDTLNLHVYYSHALGQIEDNDVDAEGRKLLRLSVTFIVANLIS